MRITGGLYKRRKILCPPGVIRPAMDRMRESLFAILGNLENRSFLDLFSGSGIVGIEAASRGANPVYLVEKDIKKRKTILQNISIVTSRIRLMVSSCELYLKKTKEKFDIVYCDPPFSAKNKHNILESIHQYEILKKDGTAIIHAPREDTFSERIGTLTLYDTRKYGHSRLYFFKSE